MVTSDRLSEVVKYLRFRGFASTQKEVAALLGMSPANLSSALRGDSRYLTDGLATKVCTNFVFINKDWLLTGEGEMLLTEDKVAEYKQAEDVNLVPLLPISAQGGSLNGFVVSVKENDCERIVSPIRGVDFAITVAGDSMAPEYPAGSQIFIKKINERAFIDWGKVYVLDTCNGSIIKRVFPTDDTNKVRCVSINPDYPPFEVAFEDIYGIYRVLLCMSVK